VAARVAAVLRESIYRCVPFPWRVRRRCTAVCRRGLVPAEACGHLVVLDGTFLDQAVFTARLCPRSVVQKNRGAAAWAIEAPEAGDVCLERVFAACQVGP
jgi:hypothetical protein